MSMNTYDEYLICFLRLQKTNDKITLQCGENGDVTDDVNSKGDSGAVLLKNFIMCDFVIIFTF